ncbi:hypothetical protein NGB36_30115 [Streptomyces sp. RB6PN25]|uniref:Lipoprotein n=1 Tax=Streptomyces humicola TaxID=2953240 RepID=A0ABT1Q463_9ACTN|nr:hypothetical protein [Streptomyces humicola]MCQ4084716.1 hypothetical protein [Streptomyces humicola]
MSHVLAAAAAAVAVLMPGAIPAAIPATGAASPAILLDDLSQHASVKPATFQVTNDIALSGLHWSGWGTPTARGEGTLTIDTCTPNCAQGRTRVLHGAELQVHGVRMDRGERFYRQYRIVDRAFTAQDRATFSTWTNAYVPSDFG